MLKSIAAFGPVGIQVIPDFAPEAAPGSMLLIRFAEIQETMSRFFFNDRKKLIDDAIEGAIICSPHRNLTLLDVDPAIRVVMRSDWNKSKVAVVSGGGSGHEPAHVGFVGKGMLTAAVCGDLFASPSVDAVLNAIMAVTGDRGCLLIVKNYTGDRLNFGLAAEKARRYGLKVEMVIVADDISLPDNKHPRGIAGTALVHKVAGFAAEQGKALADVRELAQQACESIYTLGVAMETCNLPGAEEHEARIKPGHVELGLGIHGEPGAYTLKSHNSKKIVEAMAKQLRLMTGEKARLGILINNLGGTSELEMGIVAKDLAHSEISEQIDFLIGPAPLVSSLDMKGFSLTAIVLNDAITKALQAEVVSLGWRPMVVFAPMLRMKQRKVHDSVDAKASDNPHAKALIEAGTQALIHLESKLNALDAKVGDGDTGTTFSNGARDIADQLKQGKLPLNEPVALMAVIGERLATVMGGSSGVLMSIFFTAASQQMAEGKALPLALMAGLNQMKRYGGARLGDRTLIDALQPALEHFTGKNLKTVAKAAQKGADETANITKAGAGRSSYVNEAHLQGVKDPGAVAVAAVFAALASK